LRPRTEFGICQHAAARGTSSSRLARTLGCVLLAVLCGLAAVASPALAGDSDVLFVGDSLAVGTLPYLGPMLGGRNIVAAVKSGITTPQGMKLVRQELRVVTPKTVVISLGSNDGSSPQRFADRVRRTMALLPENACVIWATIIRPPRKGDYRGLNRVLNQAKRRDPRIRVIDWEHAVTGGAVYLPDGLHADEAGYRYRSAMIADAVDAGC
jgi:lysophospholipase L1-like esterase